jgi:flagellar hook assembly protein FlgD
VANNSNETLLEFTVAESQNLVLQHVLNYPNPFTSHTNFWFEHNRPFEQLQLSVRIFTVSGKLVKTLSRTIFSEGNRSTELEWDGRDDYGDKLGRGVYIYILRVRAADGKTADKIEKLMIL